MSKKPYDLGERDRPTRGLAAHFRAKWMQAERRIERLEAEVENLKAIMRGDGGTKKVSLAKREEVERLEGVIYRNADPCDADEEDAAIIEAICRRITP